MENKLISMNSNIVAPSLKGFIGFRWLHVHGLVQKPKRQMLLNVLEIIGCRRNSFSLTQWRVWYTGKSSPYLDGLHKARICSSN